MMLQEIYRKILSVIGLTLTGLITTSIRFLTFGYGIEFNRQVVAPFLSRIVLFLAGAKLNNYVKPSSQTTIYMFNHNSYLDVFIIPALKLKKTRIIFTEARKHMPLFYLCNLGVDFLYIPSKKNPKRRIDFFKKVTKDLSEKKYSVICSPEGRHSFDHGISKFNNGVFHMAAASKIPIQTFFIKIPETANPLESYQMKSCTITVYEKDLIKTSHWTADKKSEYRDQVRNLFLQYYNKEFKA